MDRRQKKLSFLKAAGWGDAEISVLAEDASSRSYDRVHGGKGQAVLMDAPRDAEAPACPPRADLKERRRLGYNALACLAGPEQGPFVAIAKHLCHLGLGAPHVLASDLEQGFLLLEDLGDALFADVMEAHPEQEADLYRAALDVLVHLHTADTPSELPLGTGETYFLKFYDAAALSAEVDLLIDWYLPLITGVPTSDATRTSYHRAWASVTPLMMVDDPVLVLRDYHAQNLLWLPERKGVARVGLLDFQDGVLGAPAYDVVSLLEDARRDVESTLADTMLTYYCAEMSLAQSDFDEDAFRMTYALLGSQRNAKIVGIFARLSQRDRKPAYLDLLPRVWRYLEQDLSHPALADVRTWMDAHVPSDMRHRAHQAEGVSS